MTTNERSAEALRHTLLDSLPPPAREALRRLILANGNRPLFAVGGVPRDLLIGRPFIDLDLAIEGDAAALLRAALPAARIVKHALFATASTAVDGVGIDVAMARTETYDRPGALPRVRPGNIEEDMRRRDFSINAIALRLDGPSFLVDPCGGIADIDAQRVRVLHEGSFIDDPTRIFRALRYAARLGFALDARTAELLRRDVPQIAEVGDERIRREIELILVEETAGVTLEACQATGLLRALHPALCWDSARSQALTAAAAVPRTTLGFALLAADADRAAAAQIVERLRLKRAEAAAVTAMPALMPLATTLCRPEVKPSGVAVLLDRFPPPAVAAFAGVAGEPIARQLALRYLEVWRRVKPLLSGRELQVLGVPTGPQLQRGLQLIRAARLDGWANDRDDERALAMRFARSIRDAGAAQGDLELRDD